MACKALWWESMAVPADAADEENFRGGESTTDIFTSSCASWDMQCLLSVGALQRDVPWRQCMGLPNHAAHEFF